jgi:cell division protein FtsQ
VRKRWPDVLEVRVIEHRPFARWGRDRLLSDHGRLFPIANIEVPEGLPQLAGPDARVSDVVALYNESRALFTPIGMDVQSIALDPRGSWTVQLHDGESGHSAEVVVGRSEARARLGRFVRLMPQLLSQDAQLLARADLRYTNGFALTWQEAKAETGNPERGALDAPPPVSPFATEPDPSVSSAVSRVPQVAGSSRFSFPHSRFLFPAIT